MASISTLIDDFTGDSALNNPEDDVLKLLIKKSVDCLEEFDNESLKALFNQCLKITSNRTDMNDLSLSLLCNLTIPEGNSQLFIDTHLKDATDPKSSMNPDFKFALESFLSYDPQLLENTIEDSDALCVTNDWSKLDCWQHIASILCNITRLEAGRNLILRQSTGYTERLIKQIRSRNVTRRRGSIASIRNCLFDKEIHWWMFHEVKILPYLLLPLVVDTLQ